MAPGEGKDWKCALCSAREGAAKGFPTNQIIPGLNEHSQTRGETRKERELGKKEKGRECEGINGCEPFRDSAGGALGVPKFCVQALR